MQISVNGRTTEVPDGIDMAALITRLDLEGRRMAVEVNAQIVPRSQFAQHRLNPNDRVEIIQAVGGG